MWCCCRYFLTANLWKSSLLMERKKYSCLATLNPSQCCPEWKHFFLRQMHISHWFCVKTNKKYSVSYQTNKGMNSVVYTVRRGSWNPSVWLLTSHELHLLLHGIAWCKITALALACRWMELTAVTAAPAAHQGVLLLPRCCHEVFHISELCQCIS